MSSITMDFADNVDNIDINAVYNQLKKQYPNVKITTHDVSIAEQLEDKYLLALAEDRLANGSGIVYSMEEVMEHLGITREELDNTEADEFE